MNINAADTSMYHSASSKAAKERSAERNKSVGLIVEPRDRRRNNP